jgi:radial spoke head protein 1
MADEEQEVDQQEEVVPSEEVQPASQPAPPPVKIPLIWRLAEEDKVGIIATKLKEAKAKSADEEEGGEGEAPADEEQAEGGDAPSTEQEKEYTFKQLLALRHPISGESLLHWATRTHHFQLVEFLLLNGGSNAFSFKNKKELDVFKKWEEERERIRAAEEEKRQALENGEAVDEEEPNEEGEEKPDFAATLAEEMGISAYKIREIGDVGVFEGEKNPETNERQGAGMILFPNGDHYVGEYKNNMRNGRGTYKYKGGAYYTGDWVDNKRNGKGRVVYPDGGRYYGDWVNNKKEGSGAFTYPNGDLYTGAYRDDKKEGEGRYKFRKDSSLYEGTWKDNLFVKGIWRLNNNIIYEGDYKNGVPCGEGEFKFGTTGVKVQGGFNEARKWTGKVLGDLSNQEISTMKRK